VFHHDCTARHDPRLQILGLLTGPKDWESSGIIGRIGNTLTLFIENHADLKKSDKSFANLLEIPARINDLVDRNVTSPKFRDFL